MATVARYLKHIFCGNSHSQDKIFLKALDFIPGESSPKLKSELSVAFWWVSCRHNAEQSVQKVGTNLI